MAGRASFGVEEASIADIQAAYKAGVTNARAVTQAFLDRIEAYDRRGPALWAIIVTNPNARSEADALDSHLATTGEFVGPLHGIPVLVKDNYDVAGIQTTGGSAAVPPIYSIGPPNGGSARRMPGNAPSRLKPIFSDTGRIRNSPARYLNAEKGLRLN